MGKPGNRNVNITYSLFVENLEVCQESHNALKNVSEVIAQMECRSVPKSYSNIARL